MYTNPQSKSLQSDRLFEGVGQAFLRALRSQLHPRMIFALFMPVIVTLVLGSILIWLAWTPLTDWLSESLTESAVPGMMDPVVGTAGFLAIKAWMIPIIAVIILLPFEGIVGLAVAAVWIMPLVLAHLSRNNYPDVQPRGRHAFVISVWNAVWVSVVFMTGWLITLPLWLIPPLGMILSVFWWTFAFSRMMRIDAIADHASSEERKSLLRDRNIGFWSIGLICALLNLLPPAWVFLPVFSGLVFAHFGLEALRQKRDASDSVEPALIASNTKE